MREGRRTNWSTQTVLTKEGSEGVKVAENERQEMEEDEVIPWTQPSSNKTGSGVKCVQSENSKQHVSKFRTPPKKSDTVQSQKKRKTMSVKGLLMKTRARKKRARHASYRVRQGNLEEPYIDGTTDAMKSPSGICRLHQW